MIVELSEKEFNTYARKQENSIFFQSSYWGKLKEQTGWLYYLVGYKEEDEIKGVSILLAKKAPVIGKYIFYSPRGYLIDYDDLDFVKKYSDGIIQFVKEHKGIFIKINPSVIYQERDINGDVVDHGINHKKLVHFLEAEGYQHVGFTKVYGKDLEPRWISVLNLEGKTVDEYKKGLHKTTRLNVNNSYKHGLKLVQIDKSRIEEFKKLMEHTGERRGFLDRPISYYNHMYDVFGDDIKIMLVELDVEASIASYQSKKEQLEKKLDRETSKEKVKESLVKELAKQAVAADKKIEEMEKIKTEYGSKVVVAGGLFMIFGQQVVSLFGASYRQFMKYKGQYFLNDQMIRFAIENGYKQYNFYGITGEFNEDSPMFGLFDFKRGFGACVQELVGEFTYVTNPFYNKLYNGMFKIYRSVKDLKVKK